MNKILVWIILLALSPLSVVAQANNLFVDFGLSLGSNKPGASITYNRKFFKNFGLGVGTQAYAYNVPEADDGNSHRYNTAFFADMRGYFPVKKSLLFFMMDMGLDFYKGYNVQKSISINNSGFYTCLGIGYCYRVIKHRFGPYISIKLVTDNYRSKELNVVTGEIYYPSNMNGSAVLAFGFKF